jgi:hypothetical protein
MSVDHKLHQKKPQNSGSQTPIQGADCPYYTPHHKTTRKPSQTSDHSLQRIISRRITAVWLLRLKRDPAPNIDTLALSGRLKFPNCPRSDRRTVNYQLHCEPYPARVERLANNFIRPQRAARIRLACSRWPRLACLPPGARLSTPRQPLCRYLSAAVQPRDPHSSLSVAVLYILDRR